MFLMFHFANLADACRENVCPSHTVVSSTGELDDHLCTAVFSAGREDRMTTTAVSLAGLSTFVPCCPGLVKKRKDLYVRFLDNVKTIEIPCCWC